MRCHTQTQSVILFCRKSKHPAIALKCIVGHKHVQENKIVKGKLAICLLLSRKELAFKQHRIMDHPLVSYSSLSYKILAYKNSTK